jgi:threonine synthase
MTMSIALCSEIAGEHAWAFVNINIRPYYAEGSKTLAFETVEQPGWRTPDRGHPNGVWLAPDQDLEGPP